MAGLSTALELSKAGKRVVVLEKEQIAWGASGRNGGFVSPGFAQSHAQIAAKTDTQQANALFALSIEGMHCVRDNIDQYQIHDTLPVHGILSTSRYQARDVLTAKQQWLKKHFNYDVEYINQHGIKQHLTSDCYFDALHDNNAFHFNPLAYARGLAKALRANNAHIIENCAVQSMVPHNERWKISSAQTTINANHVVLCTGGYTSELVPKLHSSFLPIATYVMLTEPNEQLISTAVKTHSAILDDRRAGDYYRVVDGGRRLLWGGCITTRTTEPAELGKILHKRMVATFPQLGTLKVDYAWSGLMSYARHQMPQIGRMDNGLWYCTAFGGHGMNTTAIGGRVIAEAILEQTQSKQTDGMHTERYKLFSPFGLSPTFGSIGKAAVQATYWRYQMLDIWRERQSGTSRQSINVSSS